MQTPSAESLRLVTLPDGQTHRLTQGTVDRVWAKVAEDASGCWLWTGYIDPGGYGRVYVANSEMYAHRFMYMAMVGDIRHGLHLDHLCRVTACCNPQHLEPVTPRENIMRSPVAPAAINAIKTHCKRGHPLSGSNLSVSANGGRYCRTCGITASRKGYAAATGAPLNEEPIDLDAPVTPRRSPGAKACAKGHALDLRNTYVDPKGNKHCRTCRAAAQSRYEARKKDRR